MLPVQAIYKPYMNKHYTERIRKILQGKESILEKIPQSSEEYFEAATSNCENIIGTVSVPVGVAGPLKIQDIAEEIAVPLATTEGCLVASINRGMKAIYESGGAKVTIKKVGITRAPVFEVESKEQSQKAIAWCKDNLEELKAKTRETSRFLELLKVETRAANAPQGTDLLFIKFYFDAKDAMGMNMATIACEHLIKELIEPQTGLKCIALSGNLCVDKKPARENIEKGRGFTTTAEVRITKSVLKEVLKTSSEAINNVYEAKIVTGSALAGSLGANSHIANVVAALYLATGQDIAHTVEGSLGSTEVKIDDKGGVIVRVHLPAIICGVIGGGTKLPKQQEALKLLGVLADETKPGAANEKFAKIITATVLAGELSLLAALASSDLAQAHASLRKRQS